VGHHDGVFHVVFVEPRIPPNSGNAIRMCAATGAHLHLVEPLGFTMTDAQLRRAGLDYHDLAVVTVHPDLDQVGLRLHHGGHAVVRRRRLPAG
jgi:tRNA (cytidine/uridine-2'-O-)-methyltransferase